MAEAYTAYEIAKIRSFGGKSSSVVRWLATLAERDARIDRDYADAMIAHRWFAEHFGEIMNGRDFAAKCPLATENIVTLRARIAELETCPHCGVEIQDGDSIVRRSGRYRHIVCPTIVDRIRAERRELVFGSQR